MVAFAVLCTVVILKLRSFQVAEIKDKIVACIIWQCEIKEKMNAVNAVGHFRHRKRLNKTHFKALLMVLMVVRHSLKWTHLKVMHVSPWWNLLHRLGPVRIYNIFRGVLMWHWRGNANQITFWGACSHVLIDEAARVFGASKVKSTSTGPASNVHQRLLLFSGELKQLACVRPCVRLPGTKIDCTFVLLTIYLSCR